MKKSGLQYQIEKIVSNGLMFYSKTDFNHSGSIYADLVNLDKVKNSNEGLEAHLYGLWKLGEEDKDVSRYLDSSKLGKMRILLNQIGRETRYEMKIHKAVSAEGKRKGGLVFLLKKNFGLFLPAYLSKDSNK